MHNATALSSSRCDVRSLPDTSTERRCHLERRGRLNDWRRGSILSLALGRNSALRRQQMEEVSAADAEGYECRRRRS